MRGRWRALVGPGGVEPPASSRSGRRSAAELQASGCATTPAGCHARIRTRNLGLNRTSRYVAPRGSEGGGGGIRTPMSSRTPVFGTVAPACVRSLRGWSGQAPTGGPVCVGHVLFRLSYGPMARRAPPPAAREGASSVARTRPGDRHWAGTGGEARTPNGPGSGDRRSTALSYTRVIAPPPAGGVRVERTTSWASARRCYPLSYPPVHGATIDPWWVDPRGLEPRASAVRGRCSPR
jgi:hypothetical protein